MRGEPPPACRRQPGGIEDPHSLEGMCMTNDLVLQQLLAVHEQLESRIAARMELHQRSVIKAVVSLERRLRVGHAQDAEDESECTPASVGNKASETWASTLVGSGGLAAAGGAESLPAGGGGQQRTALGQGPLGHAGTADALDGEVSDAAILNRVEVSAQTSSRTQSYPDLVTSKSLSELASQVQELSGLSNQLAEDKKSIRVSYRMSDAARRNTSSRSNTALATKLATRWEFEALIAISICANAVTLGWNSDWSMKNPGSQRPVSYAILDLAFLCIFISELVLRMIGEGCAFFHYRAKMFRWNVFDTVVISLTLLNEINVLGADASVVRVLRVLRLVYVVRVVRMMRWFLELRMLVDGIMNCGKTLLWSALILVVVTYVYAIVCLQVCSEWLSRSTGGPSETREFLEVNFPSLVHSVYTLFKAVMGGVDWGELSDPLQNVSTVLVLTFPIFMIVTVFCVLNVITAAFVEAAARKSQEDEASALEHIAERKKWIKAISDIFDRHNKDASGSLGWEEFQEVVSDWRTRTAFMDIGIDMSFQQAKTMFRLFDWNGDGRIDINEFAQGVHHLRGVARSLDVFRHFMKLSKQLEGITRMIRQDRLSSGGGDCGVTRGYYSTAEASQETNTTGSEVD